MAPATGKRSNLKNMTINYHEIAALYSRRRFNFLTKRYWVDTLGTHLTPLIEGSLVIPWLPLKSYTFCGSLKSARSNHNMKSENQKRLELDSSQKLLQPNLVVEVEFFAETVATSLYATHREVELLGNLFGADVHLQK